MAEQLTINGFLERRLVDVRREAQEYVDRSGVKLSQCRLLLKLYFANLDSGLTDWEASELMAGVLGIAPEFFPRDRAGARRHDLMVRFPGLIVWAGTRKNLFSGLDNDVYKISEVQF